MKQKWLCGADRKAERSVQHVGDGLCGGGVRRSMVLRRDNGATGRSEICSPVNASLGVRACSGGEVWRWNMEAREVLRLPALTPRVSLCWQAPHSWSARKKWMSCSAQ